MSAFPDPLVTSSYCAVCAHTLEAAARADSQTRDTLDQEDGGLAEEADTSTLTLQQEHEQSQGHIHLLQQFKEFREFCQQHLAPRLLRIGQFFKDVQVSLQPRQVEVLVFCGPFRVDWLTAKYKQNIPTVLLVISKLL